MKVVSARARVRFPPRVIIIALRERLVRFVAIMRNRSLTNAGGTRHKKGKSSTCITVDPFDMV